MTNARQLTVKSVTYNLLRQIGIATVVGNPGSSEIPFLADFPEDFRYIFALHEASAVAIADGLSQGMNQPVLVNLHSGVGLGNAMGAIVTAYLNKTPLIIMVGQQARETLLVEPFLMNHEPTVMPLPWVKWSCEPARALDVPKALLRAYATAIQEPAGPVLLSVPCDDWDQTLKEYVVPRFVAVRQAGDPTVVAEFAHRLNASRNPVLIFGADVARSDCWDLAIALAEKLKCPVWAAPFSERTPFPESHVSFAGALPGDCMAIKDCLEGHDLICVIGAPVFRYYWYVSGLSYAPEGGLIHVTDDPKAAAMAPFGDALVSNAKLFLESFVPLVNKRTVFCNDLFYFDRRRSEVGRQLPKMHVSRVFEQIKQLSPENIVVTNESPSNFESFQKFFRFERPDSFYTFASGGLGWNMPASVGLAIAEKDSDRRRPVLCFVGDGSFQYAFQCIHTSVQHKLHVIYIVLNNGGYAILNDFAKRTGCHGLPSFDFTDIDIVSLAQGYGASAKYVTTPADLADAYTKALKQNSRTHLIVTRVSI